MDAKLIVIGGKANKSEVRLKLPTTIGRSRKADLTVAHPKVSRQHCEIFEREGVLMVKDFGSLNGTFIENNRITESVLKPGDKLTVGPLTFVAVYEPTGPLPAELPDPADLPTPSIAPIELPTKAKVGRGAVDTIAARPVVPSPRPVVAAPPPEEPVEATPEAELPQTPTLPAAAAEPEPDDFSWLTGDTVPGPAPEANDEGKPAVSPAFAETVNLKRGEPAAEPPAQELLSSANPLSAVDSADAVDALANPPEADPQDFSWLDNAQDEPLNFSAFEEQGTPPLEPSSGSSPSAPSDQTVTSPTVTLARPEPPAAVPVPGHSDVVLPPVALAATDLQQAAEDVAEDSVEADAPLVHAAADEGLPDFSALAQSTAEEEPAFPPLVADPPAVGRSPAAGPAAPSRAAGKAAKPKSWWPFAGKKKDAAKPQAPAPLESTQPIEASEEAEDAAPAPAAAPEFVMPVAEEPAPDPAAPEESTGGEDDALGQFFKSLK